MAKREEILRIFPDHMKKKWEQVLSEEDKLQEIRLGVGQPVRIHTSGEERFLCVDGTVTVSSAGAWHLTEGELDEIVKNICRYSPYAFENEIRQGFLTVQGGHRIGMAGQVVLNDRGEVRNIVHIRFLNIRISHQVIGAAEEIMSYLYEEGRFLNTLLVSPPGCGKTTLLRDIIRQISNGNRWGRGREVGVVDERSEIAGGFMGIPQNDLGRRTDVLDGCPKAQGMMLLVRSMSPAVVAVDEIGNREDIKAICQVMQCGGSVVATMHGNSMEDVTGRIKEEKYMREGDAENLGKLFERYLFLEKKRENYRVREILDRQGNRLCG